MKNTITNVTLENKGQMNIWFEDRAVTAWGDLCVHSFEADREDLQWLRHPEREGQFLSEEEQAWFQAQVKDYFRGKKNPLRLTKKRKGRSYAMPGMSCLEGQPFPETACQRGYRQSEADEKTGREQIRNRDAEELTSDGKGGGSSKALKKNRIK